MRRLWPIVVLLVLTTPIVRNVRESEHSKQMVAPAGEVAHPTPAKTPPAKKGAPQSPPTQAHQPMQHSLSPAFGVSPNEPYFTLGGLDFKKPYVRMRIFNNDTRKDAELHELLEEHYKQYYREANLREELDKFRRFEKIPNEQSAPDESHPSKSFVVFSYNVLSQYTMERTAYIYEHLVPPDTWFPMDITRHVKAGENMNENSHYDAAMPFVFNRKPDGRAELNMAWYDSDGFINRAMFNFLRPPGQPDAQSEVSALAMPTWTRRFALLSARFLHWMSDRVDLPKIFCLQEVENDRKKKENLNDFFLSGLPASPELRKLRESRNLPELKMHIVFTQRSPWVHRPDKKTGRLKKMTDKRPDGCMTVFNTNEFDVLGSEHEVRYRDLPNLYDTNSVGHIIALRVKASGVIICVANTHLIYGKPTNKLVNALRVAQMSALLKAFDDVEHCKPGTDHQRIIAGDFNSDPHSDVWDFLHSGKYEVRVERDFFKDAKNNPTPGATNSKLAVPGTVTPAASNESEIIDGMIMDTDSDSETESKLRQLSVNTIQSETIYESTFEHSLSLKSAYNYHEDEITCYIAKGNHHSVDYVYHTTNGPYHPMEVLTLPKLEKLREWTGPLPTGSFFDAWESEHEKARHIPSDHVEIGVVFHYHDATKDKHVAASAPPAAAKAKP